MQVFHNEQDRLPLRFPMQPGHERLQRLLALPLRRQSDGCIGGGRGSESSAASNGTASDSATPDAVSAASSVRSCSAGEGSGARAAGDGDGR